MRAFLYAAAVIGGLAFGGANAEAAGKRTMFVLIDVTGSMSQPRTAGGNRFDLAIQEAADRITIEKGNVGGLDKVAVYTFSSLGLTQWTVDLVNGTGPNHEFIDADTARNIILTQVTFPGGNTPLADDLCLSADLAIQGDDPTDQHILAFYTDGEENVSTGVCSGIWSTTTSPYDTGSWQRNTALHIKNLVVTPVTNRLVVDTTLYATVDTSFAPFAAPPAASGDSAASASAKANSFALTADLISDSDFFAQLAADTGGTFDLVDDTAPAPVYADLDGDLDVDRNDAIAIARNFGGPAIRSYDLNGDGKVGFADYALLLSRFGTGSGTPAPDPYTTSTVVQCTCHQHDIVIDGQAIENLDITVEADNPCNVTIRNSLLVSGSYAIKTHGAVNVTVDNSIIVGETAWLIGNGNVKLSAANSVFHGITHTHYKLTDRGHNTFE